MTQPSKTKGQIEAEISKAIIRFEKEYMGRGPDEVKAYIIDDLIIIRLKRVLTPAEHHLAEPGDSASGRALIKQVRSELLERARPFLEALVRDVAGAKVESLHTDISTVTGERIIVFVLDAPLVFAPARDSPSNRT